MTSAFGGQHSIQLSYGCLRASISAWGAGRNGKTAMRRGLVPRYACVWSSEEIVTQLQRRDQRIHLFQGIVEAE